jgi:hypothetical protein
LASRRLALQIARMFLTIRVRNCLKGGLGLGTILSLL